MLTFEFCSEPNKTLLPVKQSNKNLTSSR